MWEWECERERERESACVCTNKSNVIRCLLTHGESKGLCVAYCSILQHVWIFLKIIKSTINQNSISCSDSERNLGSNLAVSTTVN